MVIEILPCRPCRSGNVIKRGRDRRAARRSRDRAGFHKAVADAMGGGPGA